MKLSGIALVSFILTSDILVSGLPGSKKVQIDLRKSNLFVKCGSAEYRSEELDEAASEACNRIVTKGKVIGIPLRSMPRTYQGNLLRTLDETSHPQSSYDSHDHNKHVLNFGHHPLLMWPLKQKFKHLNAKCYAIIQWNPDRVKCKAIAVIMREKERDDVKCSQVTIRDSSSKYAGSSIYHPGNLSPLHPAAGGSQNLEDLSPFYERDGRSSSVHETTRVPPFNSNHHQTTKEMYRAPSFSTYYQGNPSHEITEEVD